MMKNNRSPHETVIHDIRLDAINKNDMSFFYRFGPLPNNLISSIKGSGIISPLVLLKTTDCDKFVIVCGWRRYLAACELSLSSLPAQILKAGTISKQKAFILSLSENASKDTFSFLEKALILKKSLQLFSPDDPVFKKTVLRLADIPPNEDIITLYKTLSESDFAIQNAVDKEIIQPDTAIEIAAEEHFKEIVDLYLTLKPGINKQKELFTLLKEILTREKKSIHSILGSADIQRIFENNKLSNPQKLTALLLILKKMRFPHLTELEEKFFKIKKAMKLPPGISLSPPAFFEDSRYKITFSFDSQDEYTGILKKLQDIAGKGYIENIEHIADPEM